MSSSTTAELSQKFSITVMERTTVDELAHIQAIWPRFEQLVRFRGRKMYSRIDVRLNTYTVCTPLKDRDRPDSLGFAARHIGRRWYLRGRIGTLPRSTSESAGGMAELEAATLGDDARPPVEFYGRRDQIDLWLLIRP